MTEMMDVSLSDLIGCLDLWPADDGTLEAANLDIGYHRVFGGQILAQLIVAATSAVPDKSVKSLSVLFPREGDATRPLHYRVTTHHAGRTFATVEIVVFQAPDERVVAVAVLSMHAPGDGPEHGASSPDVGGPDDAPTQQLDMFPWEVRVVDGVDLADRAVGPPRFSWWMRAPESEGLRGSHLPSVAAAGTTDLDALSSATVVPGTLDQALLAYATDLTVIGTALRPVEGLSQADSTVRIATAVTSHSIWFHRSFAVTDWLLVHQEAPVLAGGRAFGRGDVFQGRDLVASFAQESMVRVLDQ